MAIVATTFGDGAATCHLVGGATAAFLGAMTKALIWDCDGVLVDSEKHSCSAWLPVLRRRGIDVDLEYIETFIGRSDQDLLQALTEKTGLALDGDILEDRQREYFRQAQGATESYPGLPALLARLLQDNLPMAVASSGRLSKVRFSLAQAGIDSFFSILCSATEVARGKPAPDLFLLAANRLGIAPADCAVIEDSVPGLQAAAAAGMRPMGFTSSHAAAVLMQAGAEATFDDYEQLPDIVWPDGDRALNRVRTIV